VGRRGIKEYRASEALALISADRDRQILVCPHCGSEAVSRIPKRKSNSPNLGRITLHCDKCDRSAKYILRAGEESAPEL